MAGGEEVIGRAERQWRLRATMRREEEVSHQGYTVAEHAIKIITANL